MKKHFITLLSTLVSISLIIPTPVLAADSSATLQQKAKQFVVTAFDNALTSLKRKAKAYANCVTGKCEEKELQELKTAGRALMYLTALFISIVIIGGPIGYAKANELLLWSAEHNSIRGVKLALKLDANVNAQNQFGKTAFMYAIERSNEPIARLLFNTNKVDISITDKDGRDAHTYGQLFVTVTGSTS